MLMRVWEATEVVLLNLLKEVNVIFRKGVAAKCNGNETKTKLKNKKRF